MIITVTMNPAIDKTVEIERLIPGGLNRIKKAEYDAGGKGINVSKTIKALGGTSIATGFLGGNTGKTIEDFLDKNKITHDFIRIEEETRTNTKILDRNGTVTELNEPGPQIRKEQMDQLIEKLEKYANDGTLVILSGSIPRGVDKNIYARIIRLMHERGAEVLLDADGELLRNGLSERPDIVKPNRTELEEYAGLKSGVPDGELLALAESLREKGIKKVVVTMGKKGAIFLQDNFAAISPGLSVKAHSTVGAGDAMAAALALAWEEKLTCDETVRLGMAVSAGAVTTTGTKPPERKVVEELMGQVVIKRI